MAFRIADGFVEIHAEINKNQIRQAATRAGDLSGEHFMKSMAARGDRDGAAGRAVAGSFMAGFSDWVTRPNRGLLMAFRTGIPAILASPAGIAGGLIGAVFVGSLVSAVIGSAALGLVGLGLLGLGAFGVRGSEQVAESWKGTLAGMNAGLADAASSLVGPFANAADQVGDAFATRIGPRLKSIFAGLAPSVPDLVDGLTGGIGAFLGGIDGGKLGDFLSKMGPQFQRLGEAAGQFVSTMLDHGPDIARAFEGVTTIVVRLLDALEDIIVVGVNVFNFVVGLDKAIRDSPLWDFFGPFGPIGGIVRGLDLFGTGGEKALLKFNDAGQELGPTLLGLGESVDISRLSMLAAVEAAGSLSEALDQLNGGALSARAAERAFQAAIDDAAASIEENGRTLDANTEKGRANQAALDAIAETAQAAADAEFALSQDTNLATGKLMEGREALIKAAVQMGLNKAAAKALADEILGVPRLWATQFRNNAKAQQGVIADYIRRIRDIPDDQTVTITTRFVNQFITEQFGPNAPQIERRFGGLSFARNGLLNLSGTAGMFPDGANLFGFAERGTGGEAFIARNAPRERSLGILAEAAGWHRAVVVPMEKAATTMASAASMQQPLAAAPAAVHRVEVLLDGAMIEPRMVRVIEEHDDRMVTNIRMGVGAAR